jgi:hypothetical protein
MKYGIAVNYPTRLRGLAPLDTLVWSQGSPFDAADRAALGLPGILAAKTETLPEQFAENQPVPGYIGYPR